MEKTNNKNKSQEGIVKMLKYGASALAFVSFLTTLNGLNGIVTNSIMMASMISFGIQSIILVMGLYFIDTCSIIMSKSIRTRFKILLIAAMILLYLFSVTFSSAFSYVYISNAAYMGVRTTDYNTEIEKFLIDNTKEVKNINTAANTILINRVRKEAPEFNNLLIKYKKDSQNAIDMIVKDKIKYTVATISDDNLFSSDRAAQAYLAMNGTLPSEALMVSIKTLENSINKHTTDYINYYNSYSELFDEMATQADISKAKDRIDEISGKIDKMNQSISLLQGYNKNIDLNSINAYVNSVCSGIITDYNALINAFEDISNVYQKINNNDKTNKESLSLNEFYQVLYSRQIIQDDVLNSALSNLNEIIVAYINNTDLNTTDAQTINKLSICISYLEELKTIRETNKKIEQFEDGQLNKTYILVDSSDNNTNSNNSDKSNNSDSSKNSSSSENLNDYNYNRISQEEWNKARHKDIADFIDIVKSLPNIELLIQYSDESSSDSNIEYLKSINDSNYISDILKQSYDYNRDKLEKISDIERSWNYFYSEKNLLAWFCLIISIFLDISSMLIGFFLYTSQKKSQHPDVDEEISN